MESHDSNRAAATLAERLDKSSDAPLNAESIIAVWRSIEIALLPIIGQRGVAALYKRSLHLAGQTYPWLLGIADGTPIAIDLAALAAVFAKQSSADVTAGGMAVIQTFYELLAALIGRSLTDRLLGSVWAHSFDNSSIQDRPS